MTEFTEEQEKEIQERILKAQQESRAKEQWVIAGDQFYRESIIAVASKVQQGIYDPFILDVGKSLYTSFRKSNFIQQQENVKDEDKQE